MDKGPDVFAAIGDPTRRHILLLLTTGALSINMLAGNFDISRPAISKHVKILREAGLIAINDVGRERYCALNVEGFNEIRDWLDFFDKFWKKNLARLGDLLDTKYSSSKTKQK